MLCDLIHVKISSVKWPVLIYIVGSITSQAMKVIFSSKVEVKTFETYWTWSFALEIEKYYTQKK